MPKSRREVAADINSHINPAEFAIDEALASTGRLMLAIIEGRQRAKFAAEVGQDALVSVIGALSTMAVAREQIVVSHRQLKTTASAFKLDVTSWGDKAPIPNGALRPMHVVEAPAGKLAA